MPTRHRFYRPISYQGQRCLLFTRGRKGLPLPSLGGVPCGAGLWHGPRCGRACGARLFNRAWPGLRAEIIAE
jgi:hypothetical protein